MTIDRWPVLPHQLRGEVRVQVHLKRWGLLCLAAWCLSCGGKKDDVDLDASFPDGARMDTSAPGDAEAADAPPADAPPEDAPLPLEDTGPADTGVECRADTDCAATDLCDTPSCVDGACVHTPVACDDGDPCTDDACDVTTGACGATPSPEGTSCGDTSQCCGGACLDVSSTDAHCGACGTVCASAESCVSGACACDAGFADCDGAPGCEVSVSADATNCGGCGVMCSEPTPSCLDGSCAACTTDTDCSDDGRACTGAPVCNAGVCDYPLLPDTCLVDGLCFAASDVDPTNQCLECDPTRSATALSVRVGRTCDDGLFCTDGDVCAMDATCAGTARDCTDGLDCTADSCDEAMDACVNEATTGCAIDGACVAASATNPASPQCQVCDPTATPYAWTALEGGTCDDGLFCTVVDTCTAEGVCAGLDRVCDDAVSCTVDTCNEVDDVCDSALDGASCQIAGTCYAAGTPNPLNPCERCDPTLSTAAWSPDTGATCDDGQFCTVEDACTSGGACVGQPRACDDGLSCTNDFCNEAESQCDFIPQTDFCAIGGTCYGEGDVDPLNDCQACLTGVASDGWSPRTGVPCDDGQFCTINDTCDASGACAADPNPCDDGLDCTASTCDEAADTCDHPLSGGCVIDSTCYAAGDPNPANACEACDPTTSPTAWTARVGASCDDGAFCTDGDTCNASGACVGSDRDCTDALSCTSDACDEDRDQCVNALQADFCAIDGACFPNGTTNPLNECETCDAATSTTAWSPRTGVTCDDGAFCTINDTCDSTGTCVADPNPCDDGNTCTADTCNEATDTCESATTANSCLIDSTCYAEDVVNPANQCQSCQPAVTTSAWTSRTGQTCDDGLFCTVGDVCDASAACGGSDRVCDDGLGCTADACNEATDACEAPRSAGSCLIDATCYGNGTVNPSNQCEICDDTQNGTGWTARTGTACDDGAFCTSGDVCDATGACTSTPNDCEDGLTCTVGVCDESGDACSQVISGTSCVIDDKCYAQGRPAAPATPASSATPAPARPPGPPADGQPCEDNDFCTVNGHSCNASAQCRGSEASAIASDGVVLHPRLSATRDADTPATHTSCPAGNCLIDGGSCFTNGTINPSNGCEACAPTPWPPRPGPRGRASPATTAPSAPPATCLRRHRRLHGRPALLRRRPGLHQRLLRRGRRTPASTTSSPASCRISGTCYADSDVNPGNECQACIAAADPNDWFTALDGRPATTASSAPRGRAVSASGPAAAGPRAPATTALTCTVDFCDELGDACDNNLQAGFCAIAGTCYADRGRSTPRTSASGAARPPARRAGPSAVGEPCTDGAYCTVSDSCDGGGRACVGAARDCSDGLPLHGGLVQRGGRPLRQRDHDGLRHRRRVLGRRRSGEPGQHSASRASRRSRRPRAGRRAPARPATTASTAPRTTRCTVGGACDGSPRSCADALDLHQRTSATSPADQLRQQPAERALPDRRDLLHRGRGEPGGGVPDSATTSASARQRLDPKPMGDELRRRPLLHYRRSLRRRRRLRHRRRAIAATAWTARSTPATRPPTCATTRSPRRPAPSTAPATATARPTRATRARCATPSVSNTTWSPNTGATCNDGDRGRLRRVQRVRRCLPDRLGLRRRTLLHHRHLRRRDRKRARRTVQAGFCAIGGACYGSGDGQPGQRVRGLQPGGQPDRAGAPRAASATTARGDLRRLLGGVLRADTGLDCDDGQACTTDSCDDAGPRLRQRHRQQRLPHQRGPATANGAPPTASANTARGP